MKPWLRAIRDLFIPVLPSWLVSRILSGYKYAFIAHPLSLDDLTRQFPSLNAKNIRLLKFISKFGWPVLGPEITGFRDKSGKDIKGRVIFCLMTARIMVLDRKTAVRRLITCVRMAEKLRVDVVGLGAFVPIVTHDGKLLAKKTKLNMTSGTAFSAVIAVKNALSVIDICDYAVDKCLIAIVGAAGSVGTIVTQLMLEHGKTFILIDKNEEGLKKIISGGLLKNVKGKNIVISTSLDPIKHADIIIVTTNAPGVIVRSNHLKAGAIVVDAAHPRNVSTKVPFERDDVVVVESGIANVPELNTNFEFDLRSRSEVYSCLAEVLVLYWLKIEGKFVGTFTMEYVQTLKETSEKIGIDIAKFRNRAGFVTREDFLKLKRLRKIESIDSFIDNKSMDNEANRIIQLSI